MCGHSLFSPPAQMPCRVCMQSPVSIRRALYRSPQVSSLSARLAIATDTIAKLEMAHTDLSQARASLSVLLAPDRGLGAQ